MSSLQPLTPKQERFVEEYLIDLNATQAAIRAGYSKDTANEQGSRLLAKVNIQSAIAEAKKARSNRTQITQDSVLKETASLAFGDIRQVCSWGPEGVVLKTSNEMGDAAKLVKSIKVKTKTLKPPDKEEGTVIERSVELQMWDKVKALEMIGKHLGLWEKRALETVNATERPVFQRNFLLAPGFNEEGPRFASKPISREVKR